MHICFKMKGKDLREEIEVPEGINASLEDSKIIMKKNSDELERKFDRAIDVKVEGNKIILTSKKSTFDKFLPIENFFLPDEYSLPTIKIFILSSFTKFWKGGG